jgi:hypothetical protein
MPSQIISEVLMVAITLLHVWDRMEIGTDITIQTSAEKQVSINQLLTYSFTEEEMKLLFHLRLLLLQLNLKKHKH